MATIYQRGESWYLNWREGDQQYRRSLGKIEARAAKAIRAEKEAELAGLITSTRGVTIGQIMTEYLEWYAKARPSTYRRAASALRPFLGTFGHYAAEGCRPALIERWAHAQTATASTEKALKLARAGLRQAIAQRVITLSPMDGVRIAKPMTSRAPDYYRPEQLAKLAETPRAALWAFMWNTGVRRGEMVKAKRTDVREGILYVESSAEGRTKNLRWRAIPLNAAALAALAKLPDDLADVHPDTLGDWFKQDAATAKLPGTLHWLRHTFCTILAQSGVSLHEIKRLAGHSSITVTEQYAHHLPGFGRAAVDSMAAWSKIKKAQKKAQAARKSLRPRSSVG